MVCDSVLRSRARVYVVYGWWPGLALFLAKAGQKEQRQFCPSLLKITFSPSQY